LIAFTQAIFARRARLGVRDEQLLSMREFPSPTLALAACFMSGIYVSLIIFYGIMFSGKIMCYHQDPVLLRPIATMRYIEWSVTVPMLMWTIGRVLLRQDLEAVLIPILQTLSYIWLAWAGQVVEQHWLRALLISCCFTIYAESAVRQLRWACWDKMFATSLVVYQVVMFFLYGVIYLVALADLVDASTEDAIYTCMDFSVKIGHTIVFSAMHRANDLDLFFSSLRNYLDILVGMRALVGAQFDFVINCKVTSFGLIIVSSSMMLEASIGRPLANRPLEDICFGEADHAVLRNHGLGRAPSRSAGKSSIPWERQEALTQVADMLRIDIAWVDSPTGAAPAELFVAAAGENQTGDIVLIGLKLLYTDLVEDPEPYPPGPEIADTISEFSEFVGPMLRSTEANASSGIASNFPVALVGEQAQPLDKEPSALSAAPKAIAPGEELQQSKIESVSTTLPQQSSIEAAQAQEAAKAQALERIAEIEKQRDEAAKKLARVTELQQQKDEAAKALARISELQLQEENASKVITRIADLEQQKEDVAKDLERMKEEQRKEEAAKDLAAQPTPAKVSTPTFGASPKLTAALVAEQTAALEEKQPAKIATLGVSRHMIRIPSSRHSARSFDGRSVCSLSPVEEELTGDSRTSEGSSLPGVHAEQWGASRSTDGDNDRTGSLLVRNTRPSNIKCPRSVDFVTAPSPASSANASMWNNAASSGQEDSDDRSVRSSVRGNELPRHFGAVETDRGSMRGSVRGSVRGSEGGHSQATTMKTYRTTLGESKNVQATVHFLGNGGKMQALNFTCASSCPEYQKHVESDHNTLDWGKLVIKRDGLERVYLMGHGSFAVVYKVRYQGGTYALKEFHNQAWTQRRRGFPYAVRREVSILARLASLGHPHICRLTGIVMEPTIALMFELCEGGTFFSCIQDSEQPFSWQQRLRSLCQVVEALKHLHENQVVHRDLKNNNVLFLFPVTPQSEPHVKVTDVGLARWVTSDHTESQEDANITSAMPADGAMTPIASADWHAPELATGFYGTPVDVYAFGILVLEIVTWLAMLPTAWRRRVEVIQESDQTLAIAALVGTCLAAPAERPSATQLLQSCGALTESDGEKFCDLWKGMPTESEPDKYLHG